MITCIIVVLALLQSAYLVDSSTFFRDARTFVDIIAHDVRFVEGLGPSFWDSILDFILYSHLVWTLCQCCGQGLLMEFIELVVELGNHLLDVCTFFFCIKLLEDSRLDLLLVNHPLVHEGNEWLLLHDITHLRVLV